MKAQNDKPGARPLIYDYGNFVLNVSKIIVLIITSVHLVIAGVIFYNHVTSPEILSQSDANQMLSYYQFSKGDHCYYAKSDLQKVGGGYTPLSYQIFGWTIRLMGNDIRYVRMVSGLFGLSAILFISLSVYRLTGSRYYAFAAAGLVAGINIAWFIELGANTILIAFALLGLYFLIRDEMLGWRTALLATAAFFASFWAKQTGLAYLVIGLGYIICRDWRKGLVCTFMALVLGAAGILYFANLEHSNFIWWVFEQNKNHLLIWSRLWDMLLIPIWFRRFGILVAFCMTGVVMLAVTSLRKLLSPQFLLLAVAFAIGNVAACKYGSGHTQCLLAYSLLILVAITFMVHFVAQKKCTELLICALLAVQSFMLIDDVRPVLVNDDDKQRYKAIMSILGTPGKEAYCINAGYYNVLLGKKPYGAVGADCWKNRVWSRDNYPREWREFLQTDPWDIVIIDIPLEDGSFVLYDRLNKAYKPVMEIPPAAQFANTTALRWKKIVFERAKQRP